MKHVWLIAFLSALILPAGAQQTPEAGTELSVRVVMDDSQPANSGLRVQLLNGGAIEINETFSESNGEARFRVSGAGNYRIRVSGAGIEDTVTDIFTIERGQSFAFQMITVKRKLSKDATPTASGAPVSIFALKTPDNAKKELLRGREAMDQGDVDKAFKQFNKAVELYPHYAEPIDLMGVIAVRTNPKTAASYFEKAIKADEQYVPAYLHLAKIRIGGRFYDEAERLLTKASSLDPQSSEALFFLAYTQLAKKNYDSAIQNAERAHQLDHDPYALLHFVEAEAYEKKNMPTEAIAQYAMYLKESPRGPSAAQAKKAIQQLQAKK